MAGRGKNGSDWDRWVLSTIVFHLRSGIPFSADREVVTWFVADGAKAMAEAAREAKTVAVKDFMVMRYKCALAVTVVGLSFES